MAPGDVTYGIGHRHHAQTETERNPNQSNADLRKCRSYDSTSASAERQPKCPDRLGCALLKCSIVHQLLPKLLCRGRLPAFLWLAVYGLGLALLDLDQSSACKERRLSRSQACPLVGSGSWGS